MSKHLAETTHDALPTTPINTAILDVRDASEFERRRHPEAVNIPLESLVDRMHELPPPDEPLVVFDACRVRARWAVSRLRSRGRMNLMPIFGEPWLDANGTAAGPSAQRLWKAHALLTNIALPAMRDAWGTLTGRQALDLAAGSGRDAIVMAEAGLAVEAWDILGDALDRCRDTAARCGVVVTTRLIDIEAEPCLTRERFDAIAVFNFLHRPLMPMLADAIRPGGFVIYETFTVEQRERFGKPRRDRFLLRSGELRSWFDGWRIIHWNEGLTAPRRYVASLVAQKPEDR